MKATTIARNKERRKQRGVAVYAIMVIDKDGRRGLFSLDGQNVVYRATFDSAFGEYLRRETKAAEEIAAKKIQEGQVVESDSEVPIEING